MKNVILGFALVLSSAAMANGGFVIRVCNNEIGSSLLVKGSPEKNTLEVKVLGQNSKAKVYEVLQAQAFPTGLTATIVREKKFLSNIMPIMEKDLLEVSFGNVVLVDQQENVMNDFIFSVNVPMLTSETEGKTEEEITAIALNKPVIRFSASACGGFSGDAI